MSIRHIVNIMNFLNENPKLALYVKNFNDEKTGFIFCPHQEIKEIREGVKYDKHSMTSFAFALKACQLILRGTHNLEHFMSEYDQNVVAYEMAQEEEEDEELIDDDKNYEIFDYRQEQALSEIEEKNKQEYLEREGDKSDGMYQEYMYHPHNYSFYS